MNFRLPFTAIGVYYDMTDHEWLSPGAPYRFR